MTIDKFSGMYNGSQVDWLEGLSPTPSGLRENYRPFPVVDYNDYGGYYHPGYFEKINSLVGITPLEGSNLDKGGVVYTLMLSDGDLFFRDLLGGNHKVVRFYTNSPFGTCQNPDIIGTLNNNILFTSARHLTRGIRGVNSAENDNKLIDEAGRDFSTLGVQNGDTITNLVTGVQYTITSISTTTATNDTLNFAVEAGKTNKKNDEFIVFVRDAYDLIGRDLYYPEQFPGQLSATYWNRPIRASYEIGGGGYLIGNGNYLAFLSSDESSLDKHFKQLPFGHQLLAFEIGKLGDVLVSSYDKDGTGYLLYWDGFSDNWNEITPIGSATRALHPYKSGWVYFVDSVLYFTNGRDIEVVSRLEGERVVYNANGFNAISSIEDEIYIASGGFIFIFNELGFATTRIIRKDNFKAYPYCIKTYNERSSSNQFANDYVIMVGGEGVVCEITRFRANTNPKVYNKVLFRIDLKQETKISEVWLNVQQSNERYFTNYTDDYKTKLEVNISNGSLKPRDYLQVRKSVGKDVLEVPYYTGRVGAGYEVSSIPYTSITEGSAERFFIKSITDKGTANEKWEIEPELYNAKGNSFNLTSLGIYKGEKREILAKDFNKPIRFTDINFLGSTLWLEVVIQGDTDSVPINIQSIQLF